MASKKEILELKVLQEIEEILEKYMKTKREDLFKDDSSKNKPKFIGSSRSDLVKDVYRIYVDVKKSLFDIYLG